MAPSTRRLLLVFLVSVALVANPLWLFPNEGDTRYTYERSELVPQGDDIEYRPAVDPNDGSYYNDLARVGCESLFGMRTDGDLTERTCAFEQSVADDGPVRVDGYDRPGIRIGYVELDDGYYHRTLDGGDESVTLTLEPLTAEAVLANVSSDAVAGADPERIQRSQVAARAVATGEPVRSLESPNDVAVGQVYRHDGAYYAAFVGVVGGLSALLLGLARVSVEEW